MTRLKVVICCCAVVLSLWCVRPAAAGPIMFDLNVVSSSNIGSGVLGSVALIQNGSHQVVVAVRLTSGTAFVATGGPHNAFAFNLDLKTNYAVSVTNPLGVFSVAKTNKSLRNTPYGFFTDAIECTGCGRGARDANPGPLEFTVTDAAGISASDFIPNADGFYFSADVLGPAGGTGNIAAISANTVLTPPSHSSAVPEPASLPLFAGSVAALAFVVRRRSRSSVRPS